MKIELRGIEKSFGTIVANRDVGLTIPAGSILGLLGENGAGKSTLVKILSGFVGADRGEIWLDDRRMTIASPADARRLGIGMLHQDPLDFPPLTVLENFMLGQSGGFWLNPTKASRRLQQLSQQFNFQLDPQQRVTQLTVGERQQLEILRLLALGVKTLILDEPTTGISAVQQTALFAAARQLAAAGKSIIFVSHKLEDVYTLCDRITVMRQGQVIGHRNLPVPEAEVIDLMFGRELALPTKPPTVQPQITLHLDQIHYQSHTLALQADRLTVNQGEVIGLAGLEGNGQDLLLQLCAGLLKPQRGSLQVADQDLTTAPYRDYLAAGVGYLPADRLQHGLIRGLTIQEHVALRSATRQGFVNWPQMLKATQQAISLFNIRGQPQTCVEQLSGGNQQRTQLALLPVPLTLLLMEHPTRGLDIESSLWVWQQLIARCQGGTAVLFMSADLDEIMQYSDRVIVLSGGRLSVPIAVTELTVDRLGRMIGGQLEPSPSGLKQEVS
jgi:general nucleoside transport system ATP-binding protein